MGFSVPFVHAQRRINDVSSISLASAQPDSMPAANSRHSNSAIPFSWFQPPNLGHRPYNGQQPRRHNGAKGHQMVATSAMAPWIIEIDTTVQGRHSPQ